MFRNYAIAPPDFPSRSRPWSQYYQTLNQTKPNPRSDCLSTTKSVIPYHLEYDFNLNGDYIFNLYKISPREKVNKMLK